MSAYVGISDMNLNNDPYQNQLCYQQGQIADDDINLELRDIDYPCGRTIIGQFVIIFKEQQTDDNRLQVAEIFIDLEHEWLEADDSTNQHI